MPYYVPVGARGHLLRIGSFLIVLVGSYAYWRAWRRRVKLALSAS